MTNTEQFFNRFRGLGRAHGIYELPDKKKAKPGTKLQGSGRTMREPPTVKLWADHLKGKTTIGIVPIRDDGTVRFGAIDVDDYNLDLDALAQQVADLTLPLVLCRTKSGGAHLYLFGSEDLPASLVRAKLMDWAVVLGHPGVEIFPKQTRLANESDVGNWINMPYFGDTRWANVDGEYLHPDDFLLYAEMMAVTEKELEHIEPPQDEDFEELWMEAPPCLQCLARNGFEEGGRNRSLFNIGVYLRRRYGDEGFEEHIDIYNQQFLDPPLGHKEVATVIRNVKKKSYEFLCSEPPIVGVCNRQICVTRTFGVGTGAGEPGVTFGQLTKVLTDPPTWIWDIDGERIELTTIELKDQSRFHIKCMDALNKWPNGMKPKDWAVLVRERLEAITPEDIIQAPPDATQEGTVWTHFTNYCTARALAMSREELVLGKPWVDPENNCINFSGTDFKRYLEQQRVHITEKKLWNIFRERQADHKFIKIKGKGINVWILPMPDIQKESFDVPVEQTAESEVM